MPQSEHQRYRKRFILWFFSVGVLVSVLLVSLGYWVGPKVSWTPSGRIEAVLSTGMWIVWPTWILMIDAEHADQVIFMGLVASIMNGLWYGVIGFLIWHVRHGRRVKDASASRESPNESKMPLP